MKFILDGGWYKHDENSLKNKILVRYRDFLLGKLEKKEKVLIVTNAKPAGYYQEKIQLFVDSGAIVISRDTLGKIDWSQFDCILVLGGNQVILFDELVRLGFGIDKLKKSIVYIGESAGTMILSGYFYDHDHTNDKLRKGFLPENKEIYLVHANNPIYTDAGLVANVRKFAEENGLLVVPINENEVIEREF